MLRVHARCENTLSIESPMSWVSSRSKSGARRANSESSVVQTGVKSAGCEKRTTHFPLKSPSLIGPRVELAEKSGAGSFRRGSEGAVAGAASDIVVLPPSYRDERGSVARN